MVVTRLWGFSGNGPSTEMQTMSEGNEVSRQFEIEDDASLMPPDAMLESMAREAKTDSTFNRTLHMQSIINRLGGSFTSYDIHSAAEKTTISQAVIHGLMWQDLSEVHKGGIAKYSLTEKGIAIFDVPRHPPARHKKKPTL